MFNRLKKKRHALVDPLEEMEAKLVDALEEMEAKEVAITEEEVSEAVAKAIGERFRYLQEKMKHSTTNCPNCGAALHNGKCEYCGTEP